MLGRCRQYTLLVIVGWLAMLEESARAFLEFG